MLRSNLGEVYAWLAHTTAGTESEEYKKLALQQVRAIKELDGKGSGAKYADKLAALIYASTNDFALAEPLLHELEQDMREGRTSPVTLAQILRHGRATGEGS